MHPEQFLDRIAAELSVLGDARDVLPVLLEVLQPERGAGNGGVETAED